MYTARQIGKWFMDNTDFEAGSFITPLKLQKLLYYVQAWGLALYDNRVMNESFEAWAHGPVIPETYFQLNKFGYHPIDPNDSFFEDAEIDETTIHLLEQIRDIYGIYDGKYLEELTHQETPWIETRGDLSPEARCNAVIPEDTMRKYYLEMQQR